VCASCVLRQYLSALVLFEALHTTQMHRGGAELRVRRRRSCSGQCDRWKWRWCAEASIHCSSMVARVAYSPRTSIPLVCLLCMYDDIYIPLLVTPVVVRDIAALGTDTLHY
jgi:hypothetical protein